MWGDERAICEEGTIMNGGLGQRSNSTGSLQWLQQQQSIVISSCTPLHPRKIGKVGVSPCPRERLGVWICRTASRRKAGMALLVLVSLLVFISFLFTLNKDGDELGLDVPGRYPATVSMTIIASRQSPVGHPGHPVGHPGHPIGSPKSAKLGIPIEVNNTSSVMPLPRNKSTIQLPVTSLPSGHPCQHFSLPPPPADKKRTGPRPCPVCYLPVEKAIQLMPAIPSDIPIINNLTYVTERVSAMTTHGNGGSDFGGYPTLKQREDYFNIRESMHVHCGFAKGSTPGNATGFDIDKKDLFDMAQCHGIVVASAIFGNYDELQQPKNISEKAKRDICFFMFIDEETESFLRKTSALDDSKRIGLWRIVVVHNLPYPDSRRNGKIPKLLLHRLFPNVRFSLWLDGKLELVVDPYQILERFLWRSGDTFAISRHYRRFDVFEEAEANKAAGKYDNASIDAQVEFYRREGLTHYNSSKFPITSDVPEGCVIIREHTPITNLFTCLWFNEVDRFTSRDQISFAIVRDKVMARVSWRVNMFLDCERRNFVVQAYHRDILEKRNSRMSPPVPTVEPNKKSVIEPIKKSVIEPIEKSVIEPTNKSLDVPSRKSSDDKVPVKGSRGPSRRGSSRHSREKRLINARQRKAKASNKGAVVS